MLHPDEDKILVEIERWEAKRFRTGKVSAVLGFVFTPLDRLVDFFMPERVMRRVAEPLRKGLQGLHNTSTHWVNVEHILQIANDSGLSVDTLEELQMVPMPYLDELAKRYFTQNHIFTALHGAGCGAGGLFFAFVDTPLLFMQNMKMILQIGSCYGYNPDLLEEREFALKLFCLVSSEREANRKKDVGVNESVTSIARRSIVGSELRSTAVKETTQAVVQRIVQSFAKKKLAHGVPVVGAVLGGGFNYLFTREMGIYAYMYYRKRFLEDKLSNTTDPVQRGDIGESSTTNLMSPRGTGSGKRRN